MRLESTNKSFFTDMPLYESSFNVLSVFFKNKLFGKGVQDNNLIEYSLSQIDKINMFSESGLSSNHSFSNTFFTRNVRYQSLVLDNSPVSKLSIPFRGTLGYLYNGFFKNNKKFMFNKNLNKYMLDSSNSDYRYLSKNTGDLLFFTGKLNKVKSGHKILAKKLLSGYLKSLYLTKRYTLSELRGYKSNFYVLKRLLRRRKNSIRSFFFKKLKKKSKSFRNLVNINTYTHSVNNLNYFYPKTFNRNISNYTRNRDYPKYGIDNKHNEFYVNSEKNIKYININKMNVMRLLLSNPFFIKSSHLDSIYSSSYSIRLNIRVSKYLRYLMNKYSLLVESHSNSNLSNILPDKSFNFFFDKKIFNFFVNNKFRPMVTPWYYHTVIRFIENTSGRRSVLQVYPFMSQEVKKDYMVRYKLWLPRMIYYERKLGHRFFLEEAIHIIHLSFLLKDPVIISTWFKAMILRISF